MKQTTVWRAVSRGHRTPCSRFECEMDEYNGRSFVMQPRAVIIDGATGTHTVGQRAGRLLSERCPSHRTRTRTPALALKQKAALSRAAQMSDLQLDRYGRAPRWPLPPTAITASSRIRGHCTPRGRVPSRSW
jgi:hypothetical protein